MGPLFGGWHMVDHKCANWVAIRGCLVRKLERRLEGYGSLAEYPVVVCSMKTSTARCLAEMG